MAHAILDGGLWTRKIKDMRREEIGYAVPWAYDPESQELNEDFGIEPEPGGTLEMAVRCIIPRVLYVVRVDNPRYNTVWCNKVI